MSKPIYPIPVDPTAAGDAYIQDAMRTASGEWHPGSEPARNYFGRTLVNAIDTAQALDCVKKGIFYGRDAAGAMPQRQYLPGLNDVSYIVDDLIAVAVKHDEDPIRYLLAFHAIIGMFTEAGELLEALDKVLFKGEKFDFVNLLEENGDSAWYAAMLNFAIGTDTATMQQININKLRKRFPEKFTDTLAQDENRDLAGERAVLEARIEPMSLSEIEQREDAAARNALTAFVAYLTTQHSRMVVGVGHSPHDINAALNHFLKVVM